MLPSIDEVSKWFAKMTPPDCTKVNDFGYITCSEFARGDPIKQIFHAYPLLKGVYFNFEINYDPEIILDSMKKNNYVLPIVATILYLCFCYFGMIIMKNLKPFKLEKTLAAWNLFLCLYSTWGMFRMVPHTLWLMSNRTFEETVCEPAHTLYGVGAAGLAVQLFCLSKIPELVDTVFIVLRKKPLIFLHWYHHVTVLLFCWNSYVTESSAGHYFASMNLTVHAVMYFYYFMQAIKRVPKWFPVWIITLMQISQMIGGTFLVCMGIYYHIYGGAKYPAGKCNEYSNLVMGGVIYASYLYLFVVFAVQRFVFGQNADDSKIKKKKVN